MKYDFTSIIDRRGRDAMAVDQMPGGLENVVIKEGFDKIPMWVADMNFPTVPTIPEAVIARAEHPAYGYFRPPVTYFDSIIHWHKERYGMEGIEPKHIAFENGVLGSMLTALRVFCSPGDAVMLHAPIYTSFSKYIVNSGYKLVTSQLILDEKNVWRMDFEDMERKIVENKVHTFVFCSPHNPCGRVWEYGELKKAYELFQKHDVFVISDEIWADLVLRGRKHIPLQSISEDAKNRTVSIYAPSKTFNLAGLVGSYRIVYNQWIQHRMEQESILTHYNSMNVLSMHALLGAYTSEGQVWVDELCEVLAGNVEYACDYVDKHFDGVTVSMPEATYMLFIDCKGWLEKHQKTLDELLQLGASYGVLWQDGRQFMGNTHIRLNLASPLSRIQEAFSRLDQYVFNA